MGCSVMEVVEGVAFPPHRSQRRRGTTPTLHPSAVAAGPHQTVPWLLLPSPRPALPQSSGAHVFLLRRGPRWTPQLMLRGATISTIKSKSYPSLGPSPFQDMGAIRSLELVLEIPTARH